MDLEIINCRRTGAQSLSLAAGGASILAALGMALIAPKRRIDC
jgi:hypothetical protein